MSSYQQPDSKPSLGEVSATPLASELSIFSVENERLASIKSNTISDEVLLLKPDDEHMKLDEIPPQKPWFYITVSLIFLTLFLVLLYASVRNIKSWKTFVIDTFVVNFVVMSSIIYFAGILKVFTNIPTSYSRKIVHISIFSVPFIVDATFGRLNDKDVALSGLWNFWISEFEFGVLCTIPYRNLFNRCLGDLYDKHNNLCKRLLNFPSIIFTALERKEDRPNTLIWIQSQIVLLYIFLGILVVINKATIDTNNSLIILIPTLITGFGDGLAEPIGRKYGKNYQYSVYACCTKHRYVRSYPGSFMVWIVGVIAVCISYTKFNTLQFIISLIVIPIVGTIVEAKAPHTMDNPFISFIVGLVILPIMTIPNVNLKVWD